MSSPSFDELVAAVPPPSDAVHAWLTASFAAEAGPLSIAALLDLPYREGTDALVEGDDGDDDLEAWLEAGQSWALAQVLATIPDRGLAWCGAAVRAAWTWWRPVIEPVPAHDPDTIERLVRVAIDPAATRDALARERRALQALPSHTSPPPWIGHFYGALFALFDARSSDGAARLAYLASCLRFACVAPDGARRVDAIAALAA